MSFYFPNIDPVYVYKRKGDATDPFVFLQQSAKVVNGKVILKEIPDFQSAVVVKNSSQVVLTGTTNQTLLANQYRVDYSVGHVYFHTSLEGQTVTIEYKGTGYVSFPAERVWIETTGEQAQKTLQNLVDNLIGTDVASLDSRVGNLGELTTVNKGSIVNAINENVSKLASTVKNVNNISPINGNVTIDVGVKTISDSTLNGNILVDGAEINVYSDLALNTAIQSKSNLNHSHTLLDITDIDVTNKADGHVLQWNSEIGKYKSQTLAGYATINVKALGAVGDEIKDDTAIIQSAIDQSHPNNAWVVIPQGNYKLTSQLILKSGTKIVMHKDACLMRYHSDNIFQNGISGDSQGQGNITIMGGKLDLRGHLNKADGSGFALGYSKNIWIKDVEIFNVYYSHGMEICAIDNALIEGCGFYGYIIDNALTRDYVEAVQIERATPTGFPYFGAGDNTTSKNIRVHYCKFGASDVAPSWPVAVGAHQSHSIITAENVEIIGCRSIEPLTKIAVSAKSYKNLIVERCVFEAPIGIQVYDTLTTKANVTIKKNKIVTTLAEALRLDGVDKALVDDNDLNGQTNAIYVKGQNIKVTSSNDLESGTSDAMVIFGQSQYVFVDGATIRKAGRYAFNIYDGAKAVKILNTFILKATTQAFSLAGSGTKNIIIRGNHIEDATLTNVLISTSGVDRLYFNDNNYPASIVTPVSSTAVNSDTTGNKTF